MASVNKKVCILCGDMMDAPELHAHMLRHKRAEGDIRTTRRWRRIREQVLARDGHACRLCGETQALEVHHLDGDWANNALSNLVTLCEACHEELHGKPGSRRKRRAGIDPSEAKRPQRALTNPPFRRFELR
jgi:5-methylcytosine-specific restriction endonuclease McrA